jgi:hypothetical protein
MYAFNSGDVAFPNEVVIGAGTAQSGYGLWVSHDGTNDALTVDSSGIVYSDTTYDNTSVEAANVYIDAEGEFYRSTASSRKYKTDINYQGVDGNLVYQLQPASFKEKRTGQEFIGFITEDVAEVDPRLVLFDQEGAPDALRYDHFSALLAKAIQDLKIEIDNLKAETTTSTESLTVVDNPDLDIETLVVQQAATFYGTLYVKGEAGFEHKVVFEDEVEFQDHIIVADDTAGTAIVLANTTSTAIVFAKEYQKTPRITLASNGDPRARFWLEDKSIQGFKIVIAEPQETDLSFDWIALAVKTDENQPQPAGEPPIIKNLLISRTEVGLDEKVEFWVTATDPDTTGAILNYSWSVSPEIGSLTSPDSSRTNWSVSNLDSNTELTVTVTVSDGINSVSESKTLTLLGTSQEVPPAERPTIVLGCTDQLALNYNSEANEDDGSCEYEVVQETPTSTEEIVVEEEPTATTTEEVVVEETEGGVGGPEL